MVLGAACGGKCKFHLIPAVAADHANIAILDNAGPPFYTATGYQAPPVASR